MALAQPRRREKWGVNLNGKSWSNDQDKLGLKMMQKLGYESGKGLGKNKDGILAPITARQKMDSKGIGFNGHDDTWLAHQDDFQAVLASLNVEHGNSEAQEAGKKSLEKLSKKSKKRVHYQKFTRGKDLANYSIDDLGCILGTKSEKLKNMQKEKKEEEERKLEEETADKKPETKHGVMTLQGGNYHDYFQKKMALLKAKGLPTFEGSKIKQENVDEDNSCTATYNVNHIKVGERKLTSNLQVQSPLLSVKQEPAEVTPPTPISTDDSPEGESTPKKKKKSKKVKKEKESDEQIVTVEKENVENSSDTSEKSSKKKKKSKEMVDLKEEIEPVAQEKSEKKKKKKKDKSKDLEEELVVKEEVIVKEEVVVQEVTKKKKNKKQEKEQIEEVSTGDRKRSLEEVEQEAEEPLKKRKKNKKEKKCAEETPEKSANESVKGSAKSDIESATLSAKQTMDDLFNPVLKKMKEVKSADSIKVAELSPKSAKKSKKLAEKAAESAEKSTKSAEKSANVLSNESAVLAMRSNFHSVNQVDQSEDHYLKSAFSALKQSAVIKS